EPISGALTPARTSAASATLPPHARHARRHPRSALVCARRADPDALGARRGHGGHGLHARLAGGDAHRRAQPDAADDPRGAPLLREHDRALSHPGVAFPAVLAALHHVTCVCSDAQQTVDYYRDALGFSLVKKTVNFDD